MDETQNSHGTNSEPGLERAEIDKHAAVQVLGQKLDELTGELELLDDGEGTLGQPLVIVDGTERAMIWQDDDGESYGYRVFLEQEDQMTARFKRVVLAVTPAWQEDPEDDYNSEHVLETTPAEAIGSSMECYADGSKVEGSGDSLDPEELAAAAQRVNRLLDEGERLSAEEVHAAIVYREAVKREVSDLGLAVAQGMIGGGHHNMPATPFTATAADAEQPIFTEGFRHDGVQPDVLVTSVTSRLVAEMGYHTEVLIDFGLDNKMLLVDFEHGYDDRSSVEVCERPDQAGKIIEYPMAPEAKLALVRQLVPQLEPLIA